MRRRDFRRVAAFVVALAACSPIFNWRETPVDDGLTALLPCKPEHAERTLALGPDTAVMRMTGCAAGGATFAVARLPGGDAAQAQVRLAAWRDAVRSQWAGARLDEGPAPMPRAAPVPAPVALSARGAAGEARMRWFAHADAQGRFTLYQATVLGRPAAADAIGTFFEGLSLR
jgi:hypothetical protein